MAVAPHSILVLRAGDALPEVALHHGEFVDWIRRAAGDCWDGDWREHDLRSSAPLPPLDSIVGVVVTGSPASVTEDAEWMRHAAGYLRAAVARAVPILGICFGHQLLAHALGGVVQRNPKGREMGTVELTLTAEDPLFEGCGKWLRVNSTHVDTVASLPEGARVLATTSLDSHAAVSFAPSVRGVQFHPEVCGKLMRDYVEAKRPCLLLESIDPEPILRAVEETPLAAEILRNFVRHFVVSSQLRAA